MLRSFRVGGRLVWLALTDQARATGDVNSEAMLDLTTRVWKVVDAISDAPVLGDALAGLLALLDVRRRVVECARSGRVSAARSP
ncbi:hypothetical protein OHS58_06070 [Amycolatopsis sp. NBC_00348]|uniref:hypothetical protein n=1 Tax=Amycolatopsis sp. NBC_00348 TaxID=2975956 RepID=UPI002E256A6B